MNSARVLVAVLVMLVATPAAREQTPSPIPSATDAAAIRKLLQSEVLSEQAWGAWFAGQTQRTELIPDLIALGSRRPLTTDRASSALPGVVLDALVQLKASPDAVWTMQFFQSWPAEALILLSRGKDDAAAQLLELARNQTGIRWLAAANLLLSRKPTGFAAVLLTGLSIKANLFITNSAGTAYGTGGGLDAGVADGMRPVPAGFPPSTNYYLTPFARPGAVVLATGPRTIYYIREVFPPGQHHPTTWNDTSAPSSQDRLDYIVALRDRGPFELALKALDSKTVVWKTGMSLDKETADYRADLTRRYENLVRALVQEKLLTDAEATALPRPQISVTVQDKR